MSTEFTPRERAEIHAALDQIIAQHQPYDVPTTELCYDSAVWPVAADYERLDAQS